MTEHNQYHLEGETGNVPAVNIEDFFSTPNVLYSSKSIVIGKNKIVIDSNKGLFTAYVARGINSTGYSALTVFDPTLGGFCQVRTFPDIGNATINATTPGEKGQELYVKIDNDVEGNKTITFGTPFKANGTVVGSTAASAIIHFISDGTNLWEVGRTTGLA